MSSSKNNSGETDDPAASDIKPDPAQDQARQQLPPKASRPAGRTTLIGIGQRSSLVDAPREDAGAPADDADDSNSGAPGNAKRTRPVLLPKPTSLRLPKLSRDSDPDEADGARNPLPPPLIRINRTKTVDTAAAAGADDTDRAKTTASEVAEDIDEEVLPEVQVSTDEASSDGPITDRLDSVDIIAALHQSQADKSPEPAADLPAEAPPNLDNPFDAGATLVTESPLAGAAGDPPTLEDVELSGPAEDFEPEATRVEESPLNTFADAPVHPADSEARQDTAAAVHRTLSNPPTPEQKPRGLLKNAPPSFSVASDMATPQQPESMGAGVSGPAAPTPPASGRAPHSGGDQHDDGHAQREDDFHAKKTEVFESPFEHEALAGRLTVLSGPAAGQEFLLNRPRNTVGRGQNNTILVPDLTMSRQQLEIIQNEDQSYLLIDLQSANGTRLNHTGIVEAELRHGDRIEAGKTEFQFVLPGNRARPRSNHRHIVVKQARTTLAPAALPRAGRARDAKGEKLDKILTWVIATASVLIVGLLATIALLWLNPPGGEQPEAVARLISPQQSQLQTLYLQGVEKVKDRDWQAAQTFFARVAAIDPEFSEVGGQLERVERERVVSQTLQEARALLASGAHVKASELAREITHQSVYFEDARKLLRDAKQREIAALFQKAQQAATDEKPTEANEYLTRILQAVPNHQGALQLQALLAGNAEDLTALEKEDAAQKKAQQEAKSRRKAAPKTKSTGEIAWLSGPQKPAPKGRTAQSSERIQINFTRGFTLYKAAKFGRAARYFRDAAGSDRGALARRATQTADRIDAFAAAYDQAKRALSAKAWPAAISRLRDAKKADRAVAATAYFKSELNAKLADAYGHQGLDAVAKSNYKTAYQHYHSGQQYQPANATLTALGAELSRQANALYIQAASKRKSDPEAARALCGQILTMLSPSHELHAKAKKMLAEL